MKKIIRTSGSSSNSKDAVKGFQEGGRKKAQSRNQEKMIKDRC